MDLLTIWYLKYKNMMMGIKYDIYQIMIFDKLRSSMSEFVGTSINII